MWGGIGCHLMSWFWQKLWVRCSTWEGKFIIIHMILVLRKYPQYIDKSDWRNDGASFVVVFFMMLHRL